MLYKVKDNPDLVRDSSSNAILNTNQIALEAYKARKKQFNRINETAERMNDFDKRLSNIENLLIALTEKLK